MTNKLTDLFNEGTTYGTPEWEYKTKREAYETFKGAEDSPRAITGVVRGLGAAAFQAASIATTLGSGIAGGPMSWNNYRISGKVSDLIRPYFGDSPSSRQLRAAYEGFDEAFDSGSFSEFSKGSGEILAMLWPVLKAGSLVTKAFIKSAPAVTAKAGELAAKNMPKFGQVLKESGAAIPVRRAAEIAGEKLGPAPMFERMVMAAGMATGFGSYDFTREFAETGDFELALKTGAKTAALSMALEAGGVTAFRTLFPKHSSTVDIKGLNKVWDEASPEVRKAILSGDKKAIEELGVAGILSKNKGYVDKASTALNKLIDMEGVNYPKVFTDYAEGATLDQNVAWYRQIGEYFKGYDDVVGFDKLAGKMGAYDKPTREWLTGLGADPKPLAKAKKRFEIKRGAIEKGESEFRAAVSNIGSIEQTLAAHSSGRRALTSTPVNSRILLKEARAATAHYEDLYNAQKMARAVDLRTHYNRAKAKLNLKYQEASAMSGKIGMWKLNYLSSPEGVAKQMGPASVRFMEAMEMVDVATNPRVAKAFSLIDDMNESITPLLKSWSDSFKPPNTALRKFTTKDNAHLVELQHTYELGLMPAVRKKYGEAIAKEYEKGFVEPIESIATEMEKIGFMTKRSKQQMVEQGTPGHAPHVMDDLAGDFTKLERMITDSLKARGMTQQKITKYLNSLEHRQKGIGRFGTIDHQRMLPGTAWEKITGNYRGTKAGAPAIPLVKDPIKAYKQHMDASIHRVELAKVAGPQGELSSFWKALMVNTGADESAANWLVDTMFFNNVVDHSMSKIYRNIQASQVLSKLSWVTLANFFQPNMTATRFNLRRAGIGMAKGAGDVAAGARWTKYWESLDNFTKSLASSDKPIIAGMVGIMEKSMLASAEIYKGARSRTALEGIAEWSLKIPGFTAEERLWRVGAAHSGLMDARETIQGVVSGKLIGQNLTTARRSLDSLGVDLDQVVKRYQATGQLGLTAEEIGQVSQQAIKQTQFTTGKLDVPPGWRTPNGKLFTQFKSFAFNAGKQTRDQVLREFDHGNYRPLAYFLTLGGMSGEAISAIKDVARDRPHRTPDGPARLLNALSHQGGIGIGLSAAQAAFYGRPLEFVAGPFVSDVTSTAVTGVQSIVHQSPGPFLQFLAKQPISSAIGAAYGRASDLANASVEILEDGWWWDTPQGGGDTMSLDELRRSFRKGTNQ